MTTYNANDNIPLLEPVGLELLLSQQEKSKAERAMYAWASGCGGTEKPFIVKGYKLLYMWNRITREHRYYNYGTDMFLSEQEASDILG